MNRKKIRPWYVPFAILFSLALVTVAVISSLADTNYYSDDSTKQPVITLASAIHLDSTEHPVVGNVADATPHPENLAKHNEHLALLDLVPNSSVTDIAVKNGFWRDKSTWRSGKLPKANANVLIPVGKIVTYDLNSDLALHTIRVDGKLSFAPSQSTKLVVDTIVVKPSGVWEMGTASTPIASNVSATVIFADNGPIDRNWDSTLLSRGFISLGQTNIYGAAKTTFLSLKKSPKVGDTKLFLSQVPNNWKVGDTVVLTGAKWREWTGKAPRYWRYDFYEKLVIKAIEGNSVTINAPLKYDHVPPSLNLDVYLANYTRNIIFTSANTQDIQQRGHVMFMHSAKVNVNYAGFYELGRSNKDLVVDDIVPEKDFGGNFVGGTGNNPRGRYSLHFHRTGVEDIKAKPAIVRGNAIVGSPGWGYVNHESYVLMEDNAAYDVLGAAFATENGNEIGAFRRNIAIYSAGSVTRNQEFRDSHYLNDLGHAGHGFWFRGQAIEAKNNVAANQAHSGFVWVNKGAFENSFSAFTVPANNLKYPATANNREQVGFAEVPILDFTGNVALASASGVVTNFTRDQNTHHDGRSIIEDTTVWNCERGMSFGYSYQMTLKGAKIIADKSEDKSKTIGIEMTVNDADFVFDRVQIDGFGIGIDNVRKNLLPLSTTKLTVIDSELTNNNINFTLKEPEFIAIKHRADLKQQPLSFIPDPGYPMRIDSVGHGFRLTGTKIDSLGEEKVGHDGDFDRDKLFTDGDAIAALLAKGYYSRPNGTSYFILSSAITDRVTGEVKTFQSEIDFDPHRLNDVKLGPNLGETAKKS